VWADGCGAQSGDAAQPGLVRPAALCDSEALRDAATRLEHNGLAVGVGQRELPAQLADAFLDGVLREKHLLDVRVDGSCRRSSKSHSTCSLAGG